MPGSPERRRDLRGLPIDPDIESDGAGLGAAEAYPSTRWPQLPPRVLAAVFAGGVAGGLARYGIEYATAASSPAPPDRFPWDTFAVNLVGAFGLAVLLVLALEFAPALRPLKPAVATGFFGAFTTFSSLATGIDQLVVHGRVGVAVAYGLGSVLGGLAAASLGFVIGRAVVASRHDLDEATRRFRELTGSGRR